MTYSKPNRRTAANGETVQKTAGFSNPAPADVTAEELAAFADARRAAIAAAPEAAEPKASIEARVDAAQQRRFAAFAQPSRRLPERPPAPTPPERPPAPTMSTAALADHWRVRRLADAGERAARAASAARTARRGDLICTANRTAETEFDKGIAVLARLALEYA